MDNAIPSIWKSKLELQRIMVPLSRCVNNGGCPPNWIENELKSALYRAEELMTSDDGKAIDLHAKYLQSWFSIAGYYPDQHVN